MECYTCILKTFCHMCIDFCMSLEKKWKRHIVPDMGVKLVASLGTITEFFLVHLCVINHFLAAALTTGPCDNSLC